MAFDPVRRRHVLFGAQFGDDPHTWGYDLAGDRWIDLKPAGMPPTDKNDACWLRHPIPAPPIVLLAIVKISTGKDEAERHRLETWSFDGGADRWIPLAPPREPTPSGNRCRVLVHAPELDSLPPRGLHPPAPRAPGAADLGLPAPGSARRSSRRWRGGAARGPRPGGPDSWRRPAIVEDLTASVLSAREVEVTWRAPDAGHRRIPRRARRRRRSSREDGLKSLKSRTPPLAEPSAGAFTNDRQVRAPHDGAGEGDGVRRPGVDLSRPAKVEGEALWERRFHDE